MLVKLNLDLCHIIIATQYMLDIITTDVKRSSFQTA